MLAWFADLNPRERRTMTACFGGWSLDALDVQIFSFVIPTLLALWKITAGAGRRTRHHHPADLRHRRLARRRAVRPLSAASACCRSRSCGTPSSPSSAASRRTSASCSSSARLQGLGFGGEWAAGAVLMGEVIRDKYRGRAVGLVQTGWVDRLGRRGAALHHPDRHAARGAGLARAVLDRHPARRPGVLDPPLRRGTGI